ncbi:hypothetical protein NMY22_g20038 [Coprinellus aureogranulatus]|nr:hypothetical protein NMY22_g20038 [Coprinellus aureogranulatus]
MQPNERKLLFVESTNQAEPSSDYLDTSKMDISICPDRSMLSVEDDVLLELKATTAKKAPVKAPAKAARTTSTKKGEMKKSAVAKPATTRSSKSSAGKPTTRRKPRATATPST